MIKKSLIQNKGNRTKAAQCLGMSRRNLQLKLKEYDIDIKYEKENK
jgi:DNA-binding NtrC family response regulator